MVARAVPAIPWLPFPLLLIESPLLLLELFHVDLLLLGSELVVPRGCLPHDIRGTHMWKLLLYVIALALHKHIVRTTRTLQERTRRSTHPLYHSRRGNTSLMPRVWGSRWKKKVGLCFGWKGVGGWQLAKCLLEVVGAVFGES